MANCELDKTYEYNFVTCVSRSPSFIYCIDPTFELVNPFRLLPKKLV